MAGSPLRNVTIILAATVLLAGTAHAAVLEASDPGLRDALVQRAGGRPTVLVVVSRYTRQEGERVTARLSAARDIHGACVIDFVGIPRLFHGYARGKVTQGSAGSPLSFAVDADGSMRSELGLDPKHQVELVVLDSAGVMRGHYVGEVQLDAALQAARKLSGGGREVAAGTGRD
jgi:hypothetical protein